MSETHSFYKDGLRFECAQCSHCCRHEPGFVYLSENDLTKLLDWSNLERACFIETYCRWVPYYDGSEVLCLRETKSFDCILWDNGCTAYDARPVQCSTYPFWDFLIKTESAWKEEAAQCPGINKGSVHGEAEIAQKAFEYKRNVPIKRRG